MTKTEASREANRRYAEKNKEKLRARNLARRMANPEYALYYGAKARAIKRGLPFEIEVSDICIPTHCPVLNIEIHPNYGKYGGADNSPSIDRMIPDLGYIKGNVHIISNKANMMKSSATPEELKLFANWVNKTYD